MEYQITRQGEIINRKGRILKTYLNQGGYLVVHLNKKRLKVHRIVGKIILHQLKRFEVLN